MTTDAEDLAQRFHEAYERLAPDYGYRTREASAVPWKDVPAANQLLMIATAQAVLDAGYSPPYTVCEDPDFVLPWNKESA